MKKLLISFFAVALSVVFVSCNNNTNVEVQVWGSWDTSLGTASFATDSVWIISGNGVKQIWSDAVQTDSCSNKETFYGGGGFRWETDTVRGAFLIDCRSNRHKKGDLFSWVAIATFGEELCPKPWRVPTMQDFIELDIALGGTGELQFDNDTLRYKYINEWGAIYGNHRDRINLPHMDESAYYWSQSEESAYNGFALFIGMDGWAIDPQSFGRKGDGLSLRCVRDN